MGIEDLYDVPPAEVVLLGGLRDGERMLVPEPLPSTLLVPLPPPATARTAEEFRERVQELRARAAAGPQPVTSAITLYRRAGITDDGLRVYQVIP